MKRTVLCYMTLSTVNCWSLDHSLTTIVVIAEADQRTGTAMNTPQATLPVRHMDAPTCPTDSVCFT